MDNKTKELLNSNAVKAIGDSVRAKTNPYFAANIHAQQRNEELEAKIATFCKCQSEADQILYRAKIHRVPLSQVLELIARLGPDRLMESLLIMQKILL